jgi:predicted O-methyltransferase YrrM
MPALIHDRTAPFDFIFIDADKPGYANYCRWAIQLSRPGTLIVADNVVRDGHVINPLSKDVNVQAIRHFNDFVATQSRLTATALQTVGAKGYDGFALLLVG